MKKQEDVPIGRQLADAIFSNPQEIKLPWYRRIFKGRPGLRPISRSKYTPHQGEQEQTRRRRQIERGIL